MKNTIAYIFYIYLTIILLILDVFLKFKKQLNTVLLNKTKVVIYYQD